MPAWGEILAEFQTSAQQHGGMPDSDTIRRKYLQQLAAYTRRSTILYATAWMSRGGLPETTINLQDMQGMMEVCRQLPGPNLDLILHSPGGTAEAAASIVTYLRQKYDDIRVFVPLAAMSAATIWAMSANRIVMGKHSQLGPIDTQVMFMQPNGQPMAVPARTIIDQFERAKREIAAHPATLGAWAPMIPQYGPGLLEMCETADALSRGLVRDWLKNYMFRNQQNAARKASTVAKFFGNFGLHKSHAVGIFRDLAKQQGLTIEDLEADQELQDAVLSVFHATMLTFNASICIKVIENNLGRGFYVQAQQIQIVQVPPPAPPRQPGP